ncbi:hypothetical protein Tco_0879460 [Tanacetum coccineum]
MYKPKYAWSVKSSQPASKSKTNTKDVTNRVKLRNKFTVLQDKDKVFTIQDACESSSVKKNVVYSEQDAQSDSKVEEMASEYGSKVVTQKGADLGFHKNVVRGASWILMGDFNFALNMEDSFLGSSHMESAMCDFKDCVTNIEVFDINSFGFHFTWNQKPKGRGGILKKLNRIMGNIGFVDVFPRAYSLFQPYRISDHSLSVQTILSLSAEKPKPFKFFNFLAYKESFSEVVSNQWSN